MTNHASLSIGMLLFESATQLDLTGAYEVFARMPGTRISLLASTLEPVRTEWGLTITPDLVLSAAAPFDVICVPGGWGVNALLADDELLDFLRAQGESARYVTSVCSGALLLGAAGLLRGYRATTHWMSLDLLGLFGATPVAERVVRDRNRITGAGVTAGIDFALVLAGELVGASEAQRIQLAMEYDPHPPFDSGSPRTAPDDVRNRALRAAESSLAQRRAAIEETLRRRR
jgi:cyclohexyl-isocyanide hydratase